MPVREWVYYTITPEKCIVFLGGGSVVYSSRNGLTLSIYLDTTLKLLKDNLIDFTGHHCHCFFQYLKIILKGLAAASRIVNNNTR